MWNRFTVQRAVGCKFESKLSNLRINGFSQTSLTKSKENGDEI